MVVRLSAAICGAAIMFGYASAKLSDSARANISPYGVEQFANRGGPWIPPKTRDLIAADAAIVGVASTYNPFKPGELEGGLRTASGEAYDPAAWTAAIRTDLREKFGGVRYGKNYRPAFALVESADKQVIVKINDVGPLREGRVIDFNEQTMRHFDPTLRRGLIHEVTITPLLGDDWRPGPRG
jgi:rare lipoprotein A